MARSILRRPDALTGWDFMRVLLWLSRPGGPLLALDRKTPICQYELWETRVGGLLTIGAMVGILVA
jgi:hypothetical protein